MSFRPREKKRIKGDYNIERFIRVVDTDPRIVFLVGELVVRTRMASR